MSTHGRFQWNELNTADVEKAKAFYGETIGWTFSEMPSAGDGAYWFCMQDGEPVGAIVSLETPQYEGAAESWLSYLTVDDVAARLELAKKQGATVLRDLWDIPGVGCMAVIREPGGAIIAWITPTE